MERQIPKVSFSNSEEHMKQFWPGWERGDLHSGPHSFLLPLWSWASCLTFLGLHVCLGLFQCKYVMVINTKRFFCEVLNFTHSPWPMILDEFKYFSWLEQEKLVKTKTWVLSNCGSRFVGLVGQTICRVLCILHGKNISHLLTLKSWKGSGVSKLHWVAASELKSWTVWSKLLS